MPPIPTWLHFQTKGGIFIGFRCVFICISFLGGVQPKWTDALNGEGAIRFVLRHVSFARWARITRWRFVSSARGFEDLKTKIFAIYFTFPLLALFSPVCSFSLLSVLWWVSLYFLSLFFDLLFSKTLDPPYPSLRNFFVGVCRVAESEGRPIFFWGFDSG